MKKKDLEVGYTKYEDEELWENLKYFLDAILPEAEKLGIKIGLHPNDPPLEALTRGVPNLIRSKEAYEKVFKLGNNSPSLKVEFCCGCWL